VLIEKFNWYRSALGNLGFASLVRRQTQTRFGSPQKLFKLTSKALLHPVFARPGSSDLAVFDQIFIEGQYRPLDAIRNVQLVIDCGANVGYSSAYFLSTRPECFVIAVEPEVGNFDVLTRNLSPYRGRYHAIQAAVWPYPEKLRIKPTARISGQEWGYSVESAAEDITEYVQAITLPEIIGRSQYKRVSLLKIDIEGAELELFKSGAESWLDLVDNIVIELHGQKCSEAFFKAIDGRGFDISTCGELTICLGRTARTKLHPQI
jgi:FkbM family methyltransferase